MSWIISRRQDLLWFHLSVLPALALGALFAFVAPDNLALLCAWGVLLDGTHVFATYARSYLAGERELPGPGSFAIVLVGPAVALFWRPAFPAFLLAAYSWAYWHLVRQHWGFVALYRRGRTTRLGSWLWLGCLWPFLRFGLTHDTGLWRPFTVPPIAVDLAALAALVVLVVIRLGDRRPLRLGPAHLYVAIVIALHILTFTFVRSLMPIMATLTLFHNLEYHRIVRHYQERRGRKSDYLLGGVIFGALWYLPRILGAAAAPPLWRELLIGAGWGVAFHHYLVDARIWRKPALKGALA